MKSLWNLIQDWIKWVAMLLIASPVMAASMVVVGLLAKLYWSILVWAYNLIG